MGMTMAEKIMARTSGRASVRAGDYVTCEADTLMCHEAFAACAGPLQMMGLKELHDPDRVVVVIDHNFPAPTARAAAGHRALRGLCEAYGVQNYLGPAGICHQVLPERGFIRPGTLVLGTDSHSTTYGAFGAAGAGIGLTEMTYVLALGSLWMQVPPTIRFDLVGQAGPALMSKDIMLAIAGRFTPEVAQYQAVEFHGPVAQRMTMSSRWTMSSMGVEIGAKFAFFPADDVTLAYLRDRVPGGVEAFAPDPDATYAAHHEVDISSLEPQVACPHDVGNVKPVTAVAGTKVDQVFLGSCTNARMEDFEVAARILSGRRVHPNVRMICTPASQQVMLDATRAGYVETLLEAGAVFTPSGCGACPGGHMGVIGPGEVCMSSTNRNFQGRMGSADGFVYLGSPATVAATAVAGAIADPREFWRGSSII
jgi:3-isopropylmalate dehydratase large subunit